MKTLPFVLLAALGAFILLPVTFETAVSLLVVGGLAAVLVSDYARRRRPALRCPAPGTARTPAQGLRLAA